MDILHQLSGMQARGRGQAGGRLAVDQGLVAARKQSHRPGMPSRRPTFSDSRLSRSICHSGPGGPGRSRASSAGRRSSLSSTAGNGPAHEHHQLVPVAALPCGVGLQDEVPVDSGLASHGLQGIQVQALQIHQFDGEPAANSSRHGLVELLVDQKAKKRALIDRTLEPFLELPGVGPLRA